MIRFKHKKSGDTIEVARVRTYINDDGSKYSIDLSSKYDLNDYEEIKDSTNYSSIYCTKSPNDRL